MNIIITFVLIFFLLIICPAPSGLKAGEPDEASGELVMLSLKHSFPERTGETSFINGDWTITVEDEVYYWAGGRLLPFPLLSEAQNWEVHDFTPYPRHVPLPKLYTNDEIEKLRALGEAQSRGGERLNYSLLAGLYGGRSRAEAERRLERVSFLGFRISVHRDIAEALKRVGAQTAALAKTDEETRAFVSSINSIEAYNWRQIRGSAKPSYHSWGLAVDILPRGLGGKAIYWLWEAASSGDWMLIPPPRRWQPPEQFIRLLENEGFVWGGKWHLYDNMHFEFRPELHELNRLLAARNAAEQNFNSAPERDIHHIAPLGLPLPRPDLEQLTK